MTTTPTGTHQDTTNRWARRVEDADWDTIEVDLNRYGYALIGSLLTPEEAADGA